MSYEVCGVWGKWPWALDEAYIQGREAPHSGAAIADICPISHEFSPVGHMSYVVYASYFEHGQWRKTRGRCSELVWKIQATERGNDGTKRPG